jgi:enoyl-CoA hydratase/carnithine racemase
MPLEGPDVVLYEKRENIATITLNRPERMNTLTPETRERIQEAWDRVNADDEVWAVVFTAAGERAFCAGMDLRHTAETGRKVGAASGLPAATSSEGPVPTWKPVVVAINGACLGNGWSLAMAGDVRLAAENAEFGLPEVRWNLLGGGYQLEYVQSIAAACELALWGDRISAERAREIGFVNRVVPADQLLPEALRWAERVCENGPAAVRAMKQLIYRGRDLGREGQALLSRQFLQQLSGMEDTREGPRAFAEKRKPHWKLR